MTAGSIGAQGFLSYTRKDNDQFENVVDKLKEQLEGRFAAATGRELEIFVDRESIGWGADWRSRIRDSVKTATFFIPVVTMRYFDSKACREELLAFYENARQLGVTELILPIVLTGAEEIKDTDSREEVRLIESLNYKNIEEAWLAGYGSPEWLRAISGMVRSLKLNLATAETALVDREAGPTSSPAPVTSVKSAESEEAEAAEAVEADFSALNGELEEATRLINEANEAMSGFSEITGEATGEVDLGSLPASQQQAALIRIASRLKGPAIRVRHVGGELETKMSAIDAQLRALVEELRSIDAEMAQERLDDILNGFSSADELAPVAAQMNEFVQVLRFAGTLNVSLRKSLQPAIAGVQSIGSAIATFESWRSI